MIKCDNMKMNKEKVNEGRNMTSVRMMNER